jgi:hypothetical protein
VLSGAEKTGALASFRSGWEVMMAASIASAIAAVSIGRIKAEPAVATPISELELAG